MGTGSTSPRAGNGFGWTVLLAGLLVGTFGLMAWRYTFVRSRDRDLLPEIGARVGAAAPKPAATPAEDLDDSEDADSIFADASPPEPKPMPQRTVGEFVLVDQEGRSVSRDDLTGKVWIADFIFTNCAGPCPAMSRAMQDLRRDLADLPDLRFVSFSVDPERDTPEVLESYARSYGGPDPRWILLTGNRPVMARLATKSFLAPAGDRAVASEPDSIMHKTWFFLVDREGAITAHYEHADAAAMERLRADVRALHASKRTG